MNPFKYGQIVKEADFCQRPKLVEKLSGYIKRGQNVYVQGERRIGKSSLICETIRRLKKYRLIYVDLLEVKSSDDFVKRIVTAIITMEQFAGFMERVFKKLSHIRPTITTDPITGMPSISLDSSVRLSPDSIHGVMDLVSSYHTKTKPVVIVFDEFQDILNLKDAKEILAILRSKVQFHTEIPYIFAGSVRNRMDSIFNDPDSAFFKSSVPLYVGPLDKKIFMKFIIDKFKIGERSVTSVVLSRVFDVCENIPGDIQQFCDSLWDITFYGDQITADHIPKALELIFAHESKGYEADLKIVTGQQLKFLMGLARFGGKAPMSSEFLRKSGIFQASSIKRALDRLIFLKIIFHYEGEYRFVNPFFRAWLLYKNY